MTTFRSDNSGAPGNSGADNPSPFASACRHLHGLGYHVIPVVPGGKAPGRWGIRHGWVPMMDWGRFRDRPPTEFELDTWSTWPDANIGIILGTIRADGARVIAVDIDVSDFDEIRDLVRQLPATPMAKTGRKGTTLFYATHDAFENAAYRREDRSALADLLVGNAPKQTIVPGSIHADTGKPYTWQRGATHGVVHADDLPLMTADDLAAFEEALELIGWSREASRPVPRVLSPDEVAVSNVRSLDDLGNDYFVAVNKSALSNLALWVPMLADRLPKLRSRGASYHAVNVLRPSTTGRGIAERKTNLSLSPMGIFDFGSGQGFSPINFLRAHGVAADATDAVEWLRRAGVPVPAGDDDYVLPVSAVSAVSAASVDSVAVAGAVATVGPMDYTRLPVDLREIGGTVGDVAEWIVKSALYPQPILGFGAGLAVTSIAAARQWLSPTECTLPLYVIGLAPSGAGKNDPIRAIKALMTACGFEQRLGFGEVTSQTGLLNEMIKRPVQLAVMDEFGSFFKRVMARRASSYEQAVTKALRELWSIGRSPMLGMARADSSGASIVAPHLTIFGASTPLEFYGGLSGASVENGTVSRLLVLESYDQPEMVRRPAARVDTPPPHVVAALSDIWRSGGDARGSDTRSQYDWHNSDDCWRRLEWSDEATHEAWIDYAEAAKRRCNEGQLEAALLTRQGETCIRIASLIAIGRRSTTIDRALLDMSMRLTDWALGGLIERCRDLISDNDTQAAANDVMAAIKRLYARAGKPVAHRELARALQRRYKAKEVSDLLQILAAGGEIEVTETTSESGGHAVRFYRPL